MLKCCCCLQSLVSGLPLRPSYFSSVSASPQRSGQGGWVGKLVDGNTLRPVLLHEALTTPACCLDTKTSQLPHVFEGLKNGLQGHVTSRFRGQGSVSPASPSHPDTEDKAHIESRPQRLKGQRKNTSRFQGDGPF